MRSTLAVRMSTSRPAKLAKEKTRIAVWDIGVSAGDLKLILDKWNKLRGRFVFTQVFFSAPRQILLAGDRTLEIAKQWFTKRELKNEKDEIRNNLFVNNATTVAEAVREKLGYDKIAILTPHMLAFEEDDTFMYNYYSFSEGNVIIVSAFEMRDFASKARRPFASSMGNLLLSQVLINCYPRLQFHDKNRGCLFDFNEERHTIVKSLKKMQIEPSCLNLVPDEARSYTTKLMNVLANYT